MDIALYGGSFNPVHYGHIEVVEKGSTKVDEMWLIPSGKHPWDKDMISGTHRMNMLELAVEHIYNARISDIELKKDSKTYTANTIRELREKYSHNFCWVIGSDNLDTLDAWDEFEYLRDSVDFIVAQRPGTGITDDKGVNIRDVLEVYSDASSTEVRDRIREGKSIDDIVPKSVNNYIQNNRLYSNQR